MVAVMGDVQCDAIGQPTIVCPGMLRADVLTGRAGYAVVLNVGSRPCKIQINA